MKTNPKIRKAVELALLDIANAYLDGLKEVIKAEKTKKTQFTDFQDIK